MAEAFITELGASTYRKFHRIQATVFFRKQSIYTLQVHTIDNSILIVMSKHKIDELQLSQLPEIQLWLLYVRARKITTHLYQILSKEVKVPEQALNIVIIDFLTVCKD